MKFLVAASTFLYVLLGALSSSQASVLDRRITTPPTIPTPTGPISTAPPIYICFLADGTFIEGTTPCATATAVSTPTAVPPTSSQHTGCVSDDGVTYECPPPGPTVGPTVA